MRGAHVTFGPKGIQHTVGIPGTGIYYTSRSGHYSGLHSAHVETPIEPDQQAAAHRMAEILMALALLTFVVLLATTLIL